MRDCGTEAAYKKPEDARQFSLWLGSSKALPILPVVLFRHRGFASFSPAGQRMKNAEKGMSTRTVRFEHRPLQPSSFRLLEIKPGNEPGIVCGMHHFPIAEAPPYEAIFHVWGDSSDRLDTELYHAGPVADGPAHKFKLSITRNLHDALCQLVTESHTRFLWADAVCINQEDLTERGEQVQIMRDIYSGAQRVITWLGPSDNDTPTAINLMEQVASRCEHLPESALKKVLVYTNGLADMLQVSSLPVFDVAGFTAARNLLTGRSWFSRIWVVQEVHAARDLTIMIGPYRIPWDWLGKTAMWVTAQEKGRLSASRGSNGWAYNAIYMWQRRATNAATGPDVLRSGVWHSSDPRDMIYARLGFEALRREAPLVPDYTKPFLQVYNDCVRMLITQTKKLYILSHIDHPPPTKRRTRVVDLEIPTEAPSWLPRWDQPPHAINSTAESVYVDLGRLCDWPLVVSAVDHIRTSGVNTSTDVLSLSGIEVDCVHMVMEPMEFEQHNGSLIFGSLGPLASLWKTAEPKAANDNDYANVRIAISTMLTGNIGLEILPVDRSETNMDRHCKFFEAAASHSLLITGKDHAPTEANSFFDAHLPSSLLTTAPKTAEGYIELSSVVLQNRRLLVTENGRIGLGPCQIQSGDTVAALFGGYSPFFLRPSGEFHQVVGLGLVHGLMEDALDALRTGRAEQQIFDLI